MSPVKYVQEAVKICTAHLAAIYGSEFRLLWRAENPFKMSCDPELNTSIGTR